MFLVEQRDVMLRFKQVTEKAMTKKVEAENQKQRCFEALSDLEDLLTSEFQVD
jgi:hypothetical protein